MANAEQLAILKQGVAVWNKWREENPHVAADLSGANLTEADLSGANLTEAYLRRADLSGADLSEADLRRAYLTGAYLSEANLREADLRRADLSAANLSGADLREADLRRASFFGTSFGDTILADARGLNDVHHHGPSHLDPGTVQRSDGLPEIFLRGCGWPERLVEYWPSISAQAIQFFSAFISYSHSDAPFATRLHDQIQGKGIRCWKDTHDLLPGDDLFEGIEHGIRIWDKVLLCCSKASLTSKWVDREITKALAKEEDLWNERGERIQILIPLDLDGFLFEGWESGKKTEITSRVVANFKGWENMPHAEWETEFLRVVKALSNDPIVRGIPPEPQI